MYYALAVLILFLLAICLFIPKRTPEDIGKVGEYHIGRELERTNRGRVKGEILFNVYVPTTDGRTTEIDLLYITRAGIFVIESKFYKGWIFGKDTNKTWTEVLYTRKTWSNPRGSEKHRFYNPIMQNNTHINWLMKYVGNDVPMFSLSVFSNDVEFKELDLSHSPKNVFVCKRNQMASIISRCYDYYPKTISEVEVQRLYKRLSAFTNIDNVKKEQHKQDVYDKSHGLICPECGGKLVLRTARTGRNAGNQFYGCSNYPKCKYTKDFKK